MIDKIIDLLLEDMIQIFYMFATLAVWYVIKLIKVRMSKDQEDLLEKLVAKAVLYVQQTQPDLSDKFKLKEAIIKADELLKKKGIDIDEALLITNIEATLKELKAEFGEAWSKIEE